MTTLMKQFEEDHQRRREARADDAAAMDLLGEARACAVGEVVRRARRPYSVTSQAEGASTYDALEAWRLVSNAWARVFRLVYHE